MKKRLFTFSLLLMIAVIAFAVIPASAEGSTEDVAYVGTYAEFSDAVNNQTVSKIVLTNDILVTNKFYVSRAVTIDGQDLYSIKADETAVWYTVSGKLNIKKYNKHLIGVNADNVVLQNLTLDCNSNAAGINVYQAQNVVFDDVSIINANKGFAALTINGSTVTFKTAFTALGNAIALDVDNGSGVTTALGATATDGVVFDLNDKTVKFGSEATHDLSAAVDGDGNPYFVAVNSAYYYTENNFFLQGGQTTHLLTDFTLGKNVSISSNATIDLNGHHLTIDDGFSLKVTNNQLTIVDGAQGAVATLATGGQVSGNVSLENPAASLKIAQYEDLHVTTTVADSVVKYVEGAYVVDLADAKIGTTAYATLDEAFAAANDGDTVILLRDNTLTSGATLTGDKKVVLDLNGMTVSGDFDNLITVTDGATLVIDSDGKILGGGKNIFSVTDGKTDITAGTYDQDISDYCTTGYLPEDNGDGTYTVCVQLPVFPGVDIMDSLRPEDPELTFALNFKIDPEKYPYFTEKYIEDLLTKYGNYYVDYVLTISGITDNGSVTFNSNGNADGYLAGQYDAWSDSYVVVPFSDVVINNNQSFYIMEYAAELMNKKGLRFTLLEIAEIVQDFDCGVYFDPEFLAANPELFVSLELKVFTQETDGEGNLVQDANGNPVLTFDHTVSYHEFAQYVAAIYKDGEDTIYFATLEDAFNYALYERDDIITLLADVALSSPLLIGKPVTYDLNGHKIIAASDFAPDAVYGDEVISPIKGFDLIPMGNQIYTVIAVPHIVNVDGVDYWFIGAENTNVKAKGEDGVGIESHTIEDIKDEEDNVIGHKLTINFTDGREALVIEILDGAEGPIGPTGPAGPAGSTGSTDTEGDTNNGCNNGNNCGQVVYGSVDTALLITAGVALVAVIISVLAIINSGGCGGYKPWWML